MPDRNGSRTPRDRKEMNAFVGRVLDSYKVREITRDEAVGTLAYVMTALETGNSSEAMNWINQWCKRVA